MYCYCSGIIHEYGEDHPGSLIWAYGFRNPFGLKIVDGEVFTAENGVAVDRFTHIRPGENYMWDGTDDSIALNSDVIFIYGTAPVHLDYHPAESGIFPDEFKDAFYVALAGSLGRGKIPGIIKIDYDLEKKMVVGTPRYFLRYRHRQGGYQAVTDAAFGPDGLYFVPLFQLNNGAIFKITYDPENAHPHTIGVDQDGRTLLFTKSCIACHTLNNDYGFGGIAAPPLDPGPLVNRLSARLNSELYLRQIDEVNALTTEPHTLFAEARSEVVAAQGDERVHAWLKYRIMEPKFDTHYSQMPNLGITEEEAEIIAAYLMERAQVENRSIVERARDRLVTEKTLLAMFAGGFLAGGFIVTTTGLVAGFLLRKRKKPGNLRNVERE
jgi:hypothetical protein